MAIFARLYSMVDRGKNTRGWPAIVSSMKVNLHRVVNARTLVNLPPVINCHAFVPRRDAEALTSQPAPYNNYLLQVYSDRSEKLFQQFSLPLFVPPHPRSKERPRKLDSGEEAL